MEGINRFDFKGSACRLSGVQLGLSDGPDMILIHGMRDHALSLLPIAREFCSHYRITMPDLRGHGHSDNSGSYTMMQFVSDLRALIEQRQLQKPIIMGHSLGGHVASRYASIYSEEVSALVLIDGMGPPVLPVEDSPGTEGLNLEKLSGDELIKKTRQAHERDHIASLLALSSALRPMVNAEEALSRLMKNNPLLSADAARIIVDEGIEPHPDGGVRWRWDPAVGMVWSTFSHDENEAQWKWIDCPVLIATGDRALDYWSQMRPHLAGRQDLQDSEIERRRRLFKKAVSRIIQNAGHMIHYDQPELLNRILREFLYETDNSSSSCD